MQQDKNSSGAAQVTKRQKTMVLSNRQDEQQQGSKLPQKKFFRSRAHCNPLSHNDGFKYPLSPHNMDWSAHYPNKPGARVEVLDIGCGFGGLTVALSKLLPDRLVLGMEIRAKVCEYVRLRIEALRDEEPGSYQNAACLRTNCMRYLPNFFEKSQMDKIFICFPDPHFKTKNHRRRIISEILLSEYAYFIRPNGRLYTVTDVEELHNWHVEKTTAHPYFERIPDDVIQDEPEVMAMLEETEESKKVARMGGKKFFAVFRRRLDAELPDPGTFSLFSGSC